MKTDEQRYAEYISWRRTKAFTTKPFSIEAFLLMEQALKKK